MALAARPGDEVAELVDPVAMFADPLLHSIVDIAAAAAPEKFDPQLLEIPCQPRGKQPLPLVGRHEAGNLLLRPIEAERFAEAGVSTCRLKLVELPASVTGLRPTSSVPRSTLLR